MNKVRTVSDTKRDFYTYHPRPINSIYRRVVEELMVEMHLLSVNVTFRYDPIYALGVVTSFDRFMEGYQNEEDREAIFKALCQATAGDPHQYRSDATTLKTLALGLTIEQLSQWNSSLASYTGAEKLYESLKAIAFNPQFKYSRLFAIGLYSLIESADSTVAKEEKQRNQVLQAISEGLPIHLEKMQKDLELYQSNLEKMEQAKSTLTDILKADRQKRQQRSLEKNFPDANGEQN